MFATFPKSPKLSDQLKVEPRLHWCCVLGCTLAAWLLKHSTLRPFGGSLRDVTTEGITDGRTELARAAPPHPFNLLSPHQEVSLAAQLILSRLLSWSVPAVLCAVQFQYQEVDQINWFQSRLNHATQAGVSLCYCSALTHSKTVLRIKCWQLRCVKLTADKWGVITGQRPPCRLLVCQK